MNTGVYTITSPSGKKYIGSAAVSFAQRWSVHKHHLRKGTHHSPYLQRAWDKYGEENMVFAVYLRCEKHECLALEQIAIDTMRPEYNIAVVAQCPMQGRRHTQESIQKMSASQQGRTRAPISDGTRQKMSASQKGRPHPRPNEASRAKMSAAQTGRRHSDATKEKLRAINIGKTCPPVTQETRAKLSLVHKGKPLTEAHKQKIGVAKTGKKRPPISEETREKNRIASTGKTHSAETKEKCRLAQVGVVHGPMSDTTREKIRLAGIGRNPSPDTRALLSTLAKARTGEYSLTGRPVRCVETGTVFATARLAMCWVRECGVTTSDSPDGGIGEVCKGKRATRFGFRWEYVEPDKSKNRKPAKRSTNS